MHFLQLFRLLEDVALTTLISTSLRRLSFIAAFCVRLLKFLSLDDVKIIRLDDLWSSKNLSSAAGILFSNLHEQRHLSLYTRQVSLISHRHLLTSNNVSSQSPSTVKLFNLLDLFLAASNLSTTRFNLFWTLLEFTMGKLAFSHNPITSAWTKPCTFAKTRNFS